MYNEDALGAEEPPYLRVCCRPTCRVGGDAGEPADPGEAEVGETEEGGGAGQQGGGVPAARPPAPPAVPVLALAQLRPPPLPRAGGVAGVVLQHGPWAAAL